MVAGSFHCRLHRGVDLGRPKGTFACEIPRYLRNTQLEIGLFEETLPGFSPPGPVGLVHIDCDLYSSTRTVLTHVGPLLKPGTYVVFDEWHGYDQSEEFEQRAWHEYVDRTGITWAPVAHSFQQFALRLISTGHA